MPADHFPSVVEWTQGVVSVRHDLKTKRTTFTEAKKPGKPADTFRVVESTKTPPTSITRLDLGVVTVLISPSRIRFRARKAAPLSDTVFKRRRKF